MRTGTTVVTGNIGVNGITLNETRKGMKVANLSIAESKGKGEERTTVWHKVTLWDEKAEQAASELKKGSFVQFAGTMKIATFTNEEGKEVTYSYLNASNFKTIKA